MTGTVIDRPVTECVTVGERAIAAVPDRGTVRWYRSQWGGTDAILDEVFESAAPTELLQTVEWQFLGERPFADADELVDLQTTEICYLVTSRGVRVFLPLWFGLAVSDVAPDPNRGVLVPVESLAATRRCRRALRRFKGLLLDLVLCDVLAPALVTDISKRACELVRSTLVQFRHVPNVYIR